MGKYELDAFTRKATEDEAFLAEVSAATSIDDVVRIANAQGIGLTAADLEPATADLSDSELEGASGGTMGVYETGFCMTQGFWLATPACRQW